MICIERLIAFAFQDTQDMDYSPSLPPPSTTTSLPHEYVVVHRDALSRLLSLCPHCASEMTVTYRVAGIHVTATRKCTNCEEIVKFSNSPIVPTRATGPKEQLSDIQLRVVGATLLSKMNYTVRRFSCSYDTNIFLFLQDMHRFFTLLGCGTMSKPAFYSVANDYYRPAVARKYESVKEKTEEHVHQRLQAVNILKK